MKKIIVVTPNYPYGKDVVFPFVKNLCVEFERQGYEVTVLCPQSLSSSIFHNVLLRPREWDDITGNIKIKVYQPYYISLPFKFQSLNNLITRLCLSLFSLNHKLDADVIYCHFWSSGFSALPFAKRRKTPLFVASGESEIKSMLSNKLGIKKLREYVKGVICVSSKNKDESIQLELTSSEKCAVIPNGVNSKVFYRRERSDCRRELGLPQEAFIVIFVGWFIERKGPRRVAAAIDKLEDVKGIFIGKGEQDPQSDGILFKGALPHEKVPLYLGAADVFVLPTKHEGCCNAVIEAMACGLPVISSNLPFNWDVLDNSNSIMVNPDSIDDIANAIKVLRDNPKLHKRLSEGALERAESLTLERRAERILHFIETKISL